MLRSRDPQAHDLSDSSDNHSKILYTLSASLVWFTTNTTLLLYWINSFLTTNASFLQGKSLICLNKPSQIEQKCLSTSLENYLQINAFPDLMLMEQEE